MRSISLVLSIYGMICALVHGWLFHIPKQYLANRGKQKAPLSGLTYVITGASL